MTGSLRALVVPLLVFSLVLPAIPAHSAGPMPTGGPVSIGGLMGLAGFKTLVFTIAMVNKAMRDAAENPMDEWRRTNVRIAMSMMPGAIAGMAAEFSKGKLGNDDLPIVQGILGGFVDKNAGDNYKKFLLTPDKRFIPKTGAGFPNVTPPPVPKQPAMAVASYTKSEPTSGGAAVGQIGRVEVDRMPTKEMVSFNQRLEARPEAKGNLSTKSTTYDDSATKASSSDSAGGSSVGSIGKSVDAAPQGMFGGAPSSSGANTSGEAYRGSNSRESYGGSAPAAPAAQKNGLPYVGSETVLAASRDLSSIEQRSGASETRSLTIIRGSGKKDEGQDQDEFFDNFDKQTKAKKQPRKLQQRRPVTRPTSSLGPTKFFRYFAFATATLLPQAHAECSGQGQDKREGADAAAILMAMAAMIAAVAPMVVASIQADADKAIAKTNADAQIKMTEITADTQKQANQIAQNVALTQSAVAANVAAMNNEGVTDRMQMQLAELRSAREDAREAEEERRKLDQDYNAQRIALAEKQSQQNLDLAKETLAAQLSEAGLRSGFSSSTNTGLETTRTTTTLASANANPVTNGSRLSGGSTGMSTSAIGSEGTALRASTAGLSPRTSGSLNVGAAKTTSFSDSTSKGTTTLASTSSNGASTSLNLRGSRGFGEGTDEAYGAEIGVDDPAARKAISDCNKLPAEQKKTCIEKARGSVGRTGRGVKPSPQGKLIGNLANNAPSRGLAARLTALTAAAPTNGNVGGSTADTLAFAAAKPAGKSRASFGGFLESSGQTENSFAKYQTSSGTPHRAMRSEGTGSSQGISGGHKNSGRGIMNLIDSH